MATYYVSQLGNNTTGSDWATAYQSIQSAINIATATDIIVVDKANVPTVDNAITADKTYTFLSSTSLYSVTAGTGGEYTLSEMADDYIIGSSAASWSILIAGAYHGYWWGFTFRMAGTTNETIKLAADGGAYTYEKCVVWLGTTNSTPDITLTAGSTSGSNSYVRLIDCKFRFGNVAQSLAVGGGTQELINCSLHPSSSVPTALFGNNDGSGVTHCSGCDFSTSGTTMVATMTGGTQRLIFDNCKVPATLTWMATSTTRGVSEVYVHNCTSGDNHFHFGYFNGIGQVVATTAYTAAGGAKYDRTNGVSWKVDTGSACSMNAPFVTPWIERYWSSTGSITPSIEVVRDANSAGFTDMEVWAEFAYQDDTGSPKGTHVFDKAAAPLSAATQTAGDLSTTDWTGESGGSWYGKLHLASPITPERIGTLRCRVYIAKASVTDLIIDPFIRVA